MERQVIYDKENDAVGLGKELRTETEPDNDSEADVIEDSIVLSNVLDLSGTTVYPQMNVNKNRILQYKPFSRDPDDEENSGFTGNEGITETQWYRDTALVIVPRSELAEFFMEPLKSNYSFGFRKEDELLQLISYLDKKQQTNPLDASWKDNLLTACKYAVERSEPVENHGSYPRLRLLDFRPEHEFAIIVLPKVMKVCLSIYSYVLFGKAASLRRALLPREIIHQFSSCLSQKGFKVVREGLDHAISRETKICRHHEFLQDLLDNLKVENDDENKSLSTGEDQMALDKLEPRDLPPMFVPFLPALVPVMEKHGISVKDNATYQSMYQTIIRSILVRYVDNEPKRPDNWARPPSSCSCKDCKIHMNHFLASPRAQVGHFSFAEQRRSHLRYSLRDIEYKFETVKYGVPHTLVVTKEENMWRQDHKPWEMRNKEFDKAMEALGKVISLEAVLGDQFEAIKNKEGVVLPAGANDHSPPSDPPIIYSDKGTKMRTIENSLEKHYGPGASKVRTSRAQPPAKRQKQTAGRQSSAQARPAYSQTNPPTLPPIPLIREAPGSGNARNPTAERAGVKRKAEETGTIDLTDD
ncbi:uncharacterized protein K452DRAFT_319763 [Aplosporella prunicola CBS 121167]|uniref:Uncharacterized protein n=1 Tax=Aplosporella prunicola CBS 121167 TaxID=1176127 RepID=A0A6A6BA37_9PEZI|nr:uncharacterized protein K452DRAFT_319763 [Aplosporella prunicola CBS 121167]KAF2140233.1 hypothetical protein K452DRAFT_319763 [Aplosporella prunicola CBS 121167]